MADKQTKPLHVLTPPHMKKKSPADKQKPVATPAPQPAPVAPGK